MKKILAIDGGGIKGIYAASLLAQIEEYSGKRICDYFDMLAGTSTGAIIVAALSLGIPAKDILELYLSKGADIFPKSRWKIFNGKYDRKQLEKELMNIFGNRIMKDARTKLLIPTYNLVTDSVQIFKTPHAADLVNDYNKKIYDVLLATTAAPVYFSPYKMNGGVYMDGGVGANNPSLIALIEGLTRCEWNRDDIMILNIGSVSGGKNTSGREKMGIKDFLTIQRCFMSAESQYASNICNLVLGRRYMRIEEVAKPGEVALDKVDEKSLSKLRDLGIESAKRNYDEIKVKFFSEERKFCG